jgi:hypothetical protein
MIVLKVGVEGILRSGLSDDFAEQLKARGTTRLVEVG